MKAAAVIALVASLAGCGLAVKYPAPTIGIVAAVIAEGTCELGAGGEHLTCAGISGGIGLALGGIVALAIAIGGDGNTVLGPDPDDPPPPDVPQDPTLDQPVTVPPADPAPQDPPPP
ncbi:MAG: hypothetical protein AB7T06_00650 [Kofleriaceae bacterium]